MYRGDGDVDDGLGRDVKETAKDSKSKPSSREQGREEENGVAVG